MVAMLSAVLPLIRRFGAIAVALCLTIAAAASDESGLLRSPDGAEVRGLVIGSDAYRHVRALKGAVADARDIENALRRTGVQDVTALIDGQADRSPLLSRMDRL